MSESLGKNPPELSQLTDTASDCLATFTEGLVRAEKQLSEFREAHTVLDEAARVQLEQLQARVREREALILGATIMAEQLGVPAPDGGVAWGAHNTAARGLAADVHNIAATTHDV